jgi:CRP-like cAMP-binding protein
LTAARRQVTTPFEPQDLWAWWHQTPHRQRRLGKDEFLFRRGDPVTALFRVEEGVVRLERHTIDGRRLILHAARAGALLAEASLFGAAYHCDASAAEDSVVSFHAKAQVLAAMGADPEKALQFARLMAAQLQAVRQRLELRNVRAAHERVLLHLELKADAVSGEFLVEGALQDIASELGLTREAFYRALSDLERRGRIQRRGPIIAVYRPAA